MDHQNQQLWIASSSPRSLLQATLVLVGSLAIFGGKIGGSKVNMGHLIALLVTYVVYRHLEQTRQTQYSQFQGKMDDELVKIDPENQFPYIYTDPTLLNLLSIALPLREGNEETFLGVIQSVNDYLQSNAAIQCPATLNPAAEYPALLAAAGLIINRFHALIYGPLLESDSSSYMVLYRTTLDQIRLHLNKETSALRTLIVHQQRHQPVNVDTIFLPSWTTPRAFDNTVDESSIVERNFHFFDNP